MTGRRSTRMATRNTKGATIVPPLILVLALTNQSPADEITVSELTGHRRLITRPDPPYDVVVAVQLDFAAIVMHDSSPVFI